MSLHELIGELRRLDKEYRKGEIRLKDYQEERSRISKKISGLKNEEIRKAEKREI